ncbi:MAG: hypothetical protein IPM92_08055 [Saprospiraceae bacterium]|nr:hypothetical protein [Saprospiraceae bacterium]
MNLLNLKTQKIKHWDLPDLEKRFSGIEKQATNSIYQIYTKDGNLYWLITGAGLYTFDKRTEKFEHWSQDLIDPSKNRHDFLVKMELEGDHGFWLASNGGRLFYFDLMTRKFSTFRDPVTVNRKEIDYAIYFIQRKSENELWVIIASRGIGVFNTKEKKFYFPDESYSSRLLFQLNSTYLLYTLPNGVVYGAALEGLIKLNPHAKIFNFNELKLKIANIPINSIFQKYLKIQVITPFILRHYLEMVLM